MIAHVKTYTVSRRFVDAILREKFIHSGADTKYRESGRDVTPAPPANFIPTYYIYGF